MTKAENVIAITALGDPRDPKTWSGTPNNIIKALEHQGYTVLSIDASIKKYQRLAYLLLHRVSGLGIDELRGPIARSHSAKIVQRQIQTLGCTKILHLGTFQLPLPKLDPGVEHYLFCDSTWDSWSQYVTTINQYTPKMLNLSDKLERESYAQIKHFFTISQYVRDNLIERYQVEPKRISVVGTGRGKIEPFTGEKDYKNGHILFVAKGRFKDKGGDLLLEGFKTAQRKNPSLKLVIVGREEYQKLADSIPNVTVKGYISWEELQNLFHTAALFAMPALNEPWGLVYLEALACKTPILGLNRNSLPEITCEGKYGFLVDEPTPDCIADTILKAFSEPEKLKQMGAEGQKYCLETFSWNLVASKIAEIMI